MKISINDKIWINFVDVNFQSQIDSVASTLTFSSVFHSKNIEHLEAFKPLSFQSVKLYNDNNEVMFTGIMIGISFANTSSGTVVNCSCYSKTGVLNDCSIALDKFPLESFNRSLKDVIENYIKPFGLKFIIPEDSNISNLVNQKILKTSSEVGESFSDYFSRLAIQKNLLLSHDVNGNLTIVHLNKSNKVKGSFVTRDRDVAISSSINCQGMHSEVGVIKQHSKKEGGGITKSKINNPFISVYRPLVKKVNSNSETDLDTSNNAIIKREIQNIVVSVQAQGLRSNLNVGDFVEVMNMDVYIFNTCKMVIKSISLISNSSSSVTNLELVLPESLITTNTNNYVNIFKGK